MFFKFTFYVEMSMFIFFFYILAVWWSSLDNYDCAFMDCQNFYLKYCLVLYFLGHTLKLVLVF